MLETNLEMEKHLANVGKNAAPLQASAQKDLSDSLAKIWLINRWYLEEKIPTLVSVVDQLTKTASNLQMGICRGGWTPQQSLEMNKMHLNTLKMLEDTVKKKVELEQFWEEAKSNPWKLLEGPLLHKDSKTEFAPKEADQSALTDEAPHQELSQELHDEAHLQALPQEDLSDWHLSSDPVQEPSTGSAAVDIVGVSQHDASSLELQ